MNPENAYVRARVTAGEPQEQNRAWWERLPMTYEEWEHDDRTTTRDRVVAGFLDGNPWLDRAYFSAFAGKRVLEIGCGAGPASCLFAEGWARVVAIDLTDAAVELTRRHAEGLDVRVERMDAEELAFADGSFDHVFAWGVLHHSANTERAVAEAVRVLRPGGTGLVMVYNRASLRYYVKGLLWLLRDRRFRRGETLESVQRFFTDGFFHRHFTAAELESLLTAAGTHVTRISVTHMSKRMLPLVPRRIDDTLKRRWGWLLVAEFERP